MNQLMARVREFLDQLIERFFPSPPDTRTEEEKEQEEQETRALISRIVRRTDAMALYLRYWKERGATSLREAWAMEQAEIREKGHSDCPPFSVE